MNNKIDELIAAYPEWIFKDNTLIGNWQLVDFTELQRVIRKLGELAVELNHHPTVTYGYNTVAIETTTHDAGNTVTELDIEFAKRTSELLKR